MGVSESANRIVDTGQAGFLLVLTVSSVLFALGISVAIFGITTSYLPTATDVVGVVGSGLLMMILGVAGAYWALSP